MLKQCLLLIACLSVCGCTSLRHVAPAGATAEPAYLAQPGVEQAAGPVSDEQPPARGADSPPLAQEAVESSSGGWALLGISAAALLFYVLLPMAAAAALCC
jgi:hypothetical protein